MDITHTAPGILAGIGVILLALSALNLGFALQSLFALCSSQ